MKDNFRYGYLMMRMISNFARDQKSFFSLEQLKKAVPNANHRIFEANQELALSVIKAGNNKYISLDNLKIDTTEVSLIKEKIKEVLEKFFFITPDALYSLILAPHFHNFIMRNNINNDLYAFNTIRALLNDQFDFNNRLITNFEKRFESPEQLLLETFGKLDRFEITELRNLIKERKYYIIDYRKLLREFYEIGFMRIDENNLHNKKLIGVPQILVEEIEMLLLYSMVRGKLRSDKIESFKAFTPINIPWNKHILAHIIMNYSKRIRVTEIGSTYKSMEYLFEEK